MSQNDFIKAVVVSNTSEVMITCCHNKGFFGSIGIGFHFRNKVSEGIVCISEGCKDGFGICIRESLQNFLRQRNRLRLNVHRNPVRRVVGDCQHENQLRLLVGCGKNFVSRSEKIFIVNAPGSAGGIRE